MTKQILYCSVRIGDSFERFTKLTAWSINRMMAELKTRYPNADSWWVSIESF